MCDDWTSKILRELEKDKARDVQSSRPHQQNLERDIGAIDIKINRLVDIYLEGALSKEEYTKKKESLLNKKKDLQEGLKDFADGDNNWFEQAKSFVTLLNKASCVSRGGNLESQKEFLEKIGSNFILKERRLIFSAEGTLRPYLSHAPYSTWWTRSQPIRNIAEIRANIKILPAKHPHLYQKSAQKATELHLLGMSYKKIGKILGIDPKTAIKAVMSLRGCRRHPKQSQ